MKRRDFSYRFSVAKTPAEVFDKICLVSKWWTTEVEGVIEKSHDEFTVYFGDSFVKIEVIEIIPENKMSWLIKNCFWSFLQNKTEWNATTIIWNISANGNVTELSITHVGLSRGTECFEICKEGWGLYVGNSLFQLITEGRGIPFESDRNEDSCRRLKSI